MAHFDMDAKNLEILDRKKAAWLARTGPKVGDFVRFADGKLLRISHVWSYRDNPGEHDIQTSEGGRFYLGEGHMEFSGSLNSSVGFEAFQRTEELLDGDCWFFDRDYARAFAGIPAKVPCPVWACSLPAPTH